MDLTPGRRPDAAGGLREHLPALLARSGLRTVRLDALFRPPSFRGGEVSEETQRITGAARDEHRARGFGFWEYALADAVEATPSSRRALLHAALRHNSDNTIQFELPMEDFVQALEEGDFNDLPARNIVSLTSIADRWNGREPWHLPMLDLGVAEGDAGLAASVDALVELGAQGAIFASGRSYHFVGDRLLSPREMLSFLARAQLLSPVVDSRWVTHQLIDGRCGLRISTDVEKHSAGHTLAAVI